MGLLQMKAVMCRYCLAIAFLFCVSILRGAADGGRNVPLLLSYCLSILYLHSKGVLLMKAALYRKMEAQAIHRRWGALPPFCTHAFWPG